MFTTAANMYRLRKPLVIASQTLRFAQRQPNRPLHATSQRAQEYSDPKAHRNFYKSHGRAIFKALTLAFFSYQVFYWAWITLETEQMKDQKNYEIKSLEGEVRLLEEGRKSHRPAEVAQPVFDDGKRILEDAKRS